MSAPPRARICSDEPCVFFRVDDIDARAEDRDRLAFRGDGPAMAGGVDASGHPTNNDQSLGSKVARQALGHA